MVAHTSTIVAVRACMRAISAVRALSFRARLACHAIHQPQVSSTSSLAFPGTHLGLLLSLEPPTRDTRRQEAMLDDLEGMVL